MSDSVKFIFKTLIKVPVIIMISYAIFNIFAFFFIYFRMLGISYVVMQTAVENNYLPDTELNTMIDYLRDTANISMAEDVGIVVYAGDKSKSDPVNTNIVAQIRSLDARCQLEQPNDNMIYAYISIDGDNDETDEAQLKNAINIGARRKQQYGNDVICGVYCKYKIIWPLDYRATEDRDTIMNGDGQYTYSDVAGYDGVVSNNANNSYVAGFAEIPIIIVYRVPGLKYYPDMLIN